jgi:hypothetical protein
VFVFVLLGTAVAAVTVYRDRALRRSSSDFVERYGR